MITDKQFRLMELAYEKGGVDRRMAEDIYFHSSSISEALNDLEQKGLLESSDAPETAAVEKVWFLTDIAKPLVNKNIGQISA